MDLEALRKFLLIANKAGYAEDGENRAHKEPDHSKSLVFEHADFKSHDNWFGGEPYGGRTVVFFQDKPFWMMVYYGTVDPAFEQIKDLYEFLQKALKKQPENLPIRGPKVLEEGAWRYENNVDGVLGIFSGEELIFYEGKPVYEASYSGGLVDQRKE